jgi:hypothetical protein
MLYNTEDLLQKLNKELANYIYDKKYVYKTCGDFIVVLEKLEDTITNESRSNVSYNGDNKLYAKYRANKLLVKKIINKYNITICRTKIISNYYDFKIEYEIEEIVYPNCYDFNFEKVCSFGIHYFLNLKRAFYYNLELRNMSGEYFDWYDNGKLCMQYYIENGTMTW